MSNVVKFKMKQVPAALSEMYVWVTDSDRNPLYSGVKAVTGTDVELQLGSVGVGGQGVIVHGDNFNISSPENFKSFGGYSTIEEIITELPSLREIDTVVIFGASIMEMSFEYAENRQDFEDKMAALGMKIDVYERATGTNDSIAMKAALPNILEEFKGKAGTTLFIIHWGGNDLSNYPADAAGIEARLREMAQDIKDLGFMIAMSNTTFRITPPYGWSSDDFNANVQQAIVDDFADIKLDMRTLTFENQEDWFGDPSSGSFDGVHPSVVGREMNREYLSETVAPFITNVRYSNEESLKDVLIQFGSRDVMTGGLNKALNNNTVQLYNTDYSEVVGGTFAVSQSAGVNNEGRGNTTDPTNSTLTVMNSKSLEDSFYSDSTFPILIDLSGANINASDTYRLQISASRSTSDTNRVAVYRVGSNEVQLDSALNPPQFVEMEVKGIDLITNKLEVRRATGSAYVYISALRVTNVSL